MKSYDHKQIEEKWQKKWKENDLYKTSDTHEEKENEFILTEFPYPSGNLHVGHWYAFAVPDIYARFRKMQGKNVLFPVGFDAFGLPAENAAIKNKLNPREWTYNNIEYMRKQMRSMGTMFDWSREVVTCDPKYYKWTQWLFLQLHKKGLVYRKEIPVNWCPSCKTVLANEQVVNGLCERCGSEVEQREMLQWNVKITDYADRLLEDLEELDWPEPIKESQRNWIGKSEGAELEFAIKDRDEKIQVFTTRPDTLFGATYMVLSPEHELVEKISKDVSNIDEVREYVAAAGKKTEIERLAEGKEKTGVKLEGAAAINPANQEEIPIFIADYVLAHYGTGAIMAVPAHDGRDMAFAKKYGLLIKQVVFSDRVGTCTKRWMRDNSIETEYGVLNLINEYIESGKAPYIGSGKLMNSDKFDEADSDEAKQKITEHVGGTMTSTYKLRDWTVSRQRYWGVPIPMIHCTSCAAQALKKTASYTVDFADPESFKDLASGRKTFITRALRGGTDVTDYANSTAGDYLLAVDTKTKNKVIVEIMGTRKYTSIAELYKDKEALKGAFTTSFETLENLEKHYEKNRPGYTDVLEKEGVIVWECELQRQAIPVPEEQLPVELPEIEDYLPSDGGKSPLAKVQNWVDVTCPSCGGSAERETDTLDTFVDSSWYYLRYSDPHNEREFASYDAQKNWLPVDLYSGGAEHTTMHLLYSRFWHKALFDLGLVADKEPYTKRMNRGIILGLDGNKMSKSKGNVVDPDDVVSTLGADTVRTYLAFIGPFNEVGHYPWSPDGIVGVKKFLERVWELGDSFSEVDEDRAEKILHKTIKKVTEDIETLKFNTAIAQLMTFYNHVKDTKLTLGQYEKFLRMIAPFAPHMAEEMWRKELKHKNSIHTEPWPDYEEEETIDRTVTIALQVNGKVRGEMEIEYGASEGSVKKLALQQGTIVKWLEGKEPKKVIYVPGRLVNIVI